MQQVVTSLDSVAAAAGLVCSAPHEGLGQVLSCAYLGAEMIISKFLYVNCSCGNLISMVGMATDIVHHVTVV